MTLTKSALITVALCCALFARGEEKSVGAPSMGRQVFEQACFACHGTGLKDAPVIGDGYAWDDRKAKGLVVLLRSALDGLGDMPPRGGCLDCSDAQIEAAVKYLISD